MVFFKKIQKVPEEKRPVRKKRRGRISAVRRSLTVFGSYFLKASLVFVGVAVISLLFVSLYEYLVKSPYMRLEQVVVKGVDGEIKREILEISKLNTDSSLLTINLNELKMRIEKHPWLRTVSLEKSFPRTLVIHAEKEEPWAIVASDKLYYMNREGRLFTQVDPEGELDYPVITGLSVDKDTKASRLDWAVQLLKILEPETKPLSLADLSEVHLSNKDGNIYLYFSSLPVVKIRNGELKKRINDLKKVITHLKDTGRTHLVRGINFDYRDGAVVSYKNG
ncbi:MAG: FtsQ-type POTRA domain-containing protein [Pseudomonadota bacterium]